MTQTQGQVAKDASQLERCLSEFSHQLDRYSILQGQVESISNKLADTSTPKVNGGETSPIRQSGLIYDMEDALYRLTKTNDTLNDNIQKLQSII